MNVPRWACMTMPRLMAAVRLWPFQRLRHSTISGRDLAEQRVVKYCGWRCQNSDTKRACADCMLDTDCQKDAGVVDMPSIPVCHLLQACCHCVVKFAICSDRDLAVKAEFCHGAMWCNLLLLS